MIMHSIWGVPPHTPAGKRLVIWLSSCPLSGAIWCQLLMIDTSYHMLTFGTSWRRLVIAMRSR